MSVLIFGDTARTPELRHEVPLGIADPFFYAEIDGRRIVVISAMEAALVDALGAGLEVLPTEEFGVDEVRRSGLTPRAAADELAIRVVRILGIEQAIVPRAFPLGLADTLRSSGIALEVDQKLFDDRRRRKSAHELAGIRRAQRAAEAGMATASDLLARAEPANGGLFVDGESLTCELVKERVQAAFLAHGAVADEMIVSHGPQTAIAHDMGSGPISADDVVLLDLFPVDLESACFADLSRTFVVGRAPSELHEWHALCCEAIALASAEVRPGVHGSEIYRIVSRFFADRGFPTLLTKPEGEVLLDGFYQ